MKYFKLRFMSTYGETNYYAASKDKKRYLELDYNRECIIPETEINKYTNDYNIFSVEYVGETATEKEYL